MPSTVVIVVAGYAITSGMIAAVVAIAVVASVVMNKAFAVDTGYNDPAAGGANLGNRQQVPPATDNKLPVVYGTAWVGGTITDLSITSNNQKLYYVMSLCEVTGDGTDTITFGDVYFGGKKVIFNTTKFTDKGTITVTGTNTFTYSGSGLQIGNVVSFSNAGYPTAYTIIAEDAGELTTNITLSGVTTGNHVYLYNALADTQITGLLDESTGVTTTAQAPYIQFYFYSNGSNSPANSNVSAINLMQSSGLSYTWDGSKLMTNCAFVIMVLEYNQAASVTGLQQTKFQITNSRDSAGDCIYDYLVNTVYGAALPAAQINTASLDALNDYCNEPFTYTTSGGGTATQPRFKFNGLIDPKRTIMANLQDMSACCDCLIKYNEITAQWGVIVQTPVYDIAMALNDSNMVSAISISPLDLAGTYNVAEVKYPDNTNQDSFNSVTFDLAQIEPSLLFPNEPVNKQSLNLPLCNNDVQAQYLATRFLKSAREDIQVQVDINFQGIQLEAGDIVTITSSNYGWVAKEFRLNKVIENFADDGAVVTRLTMGEFNSQIYDDLPITQFTPADNTGIGSPTVFGTLTAPVVTALFPDATNPSFAVQVTTSSSGITQYAEIWYSAYSTPTTEQLYFAGTSEIQSSGTPWGVSTVLPNVILTNIPTGNWYFFDRMVNSLGSSIYSPPSALLQWRPSTYQYSLKYLNVAYADDLNGTGFDLDPRGHTYYGLHNTSGTDISTNPADYTWYLAPSAFNTSGALIYLLYTNRGGRKFSFSSGFAAYAANTGAFVPTSTLVYDPSIWAGLADGINSIDLDVRTGQLIQTGTTSVGTGEIAVTNNPQGNIVASLQQYLDFGGPYTKTSAVATLTIDVYGRVVGFETPDDFDYTQERFTATSGQTVFTVTRAAGYISGQCWVMKNGLLLDESEYTDTGGSTGTVTLAVGATLNDVITITSFKSVNSTSGVYASFTRNSATLTNQATYTASGFTLNNGYELLFLNGTIVNSQDYDISGQDITFIGNASGDLQVIQWSQNNLGVANGTPVNVDTFTVIGQTIYPFSYNINAFNLFDNGVLAKQGTDYTTGTNTYTLANSPTTITNLMVQQTFARTGAV